MASPHGAIIHDRSSIVKRSKRKKYRLDDNDLEGYNGRPLKRRRSPVTVCIAAITTYYDDKGTASGTSVVGASDRMLTAGDVEFEPQTSKIVQLTTSVFLMTAGDSAFQAEVCREVQRTVSERIAAEPQNWWRVKDVAYLYLHTMDTIKQKRAEEALLVPLKLDGDTFLARAHELPRELVQELKDEIQNFRIPEVETIVTGVDTDGGAHIYTVGTHNGISNFLNCHDSVGFAAIGSGYWHANSQLMIGGHTRLSPGPETLALVYAAKKRAEVAPGVGKETDIFVIGTNLGAHFTATEEEKKLLEGMYDQIRRGESIAFKDGIVEVRKYFEGAKKKAAEQPQPQATSPSAPPTPPPPNGGGKEKNG